MLYLEQEFTKEHTLKTTLLMVFVITLLTSLNVFAQSSTSQLSKSCYSILDIDTDPSDVYAAISSDLVNPLVESQLENYGLKLENELIVEGNRSLTSTDCDNLKLIDHCLEALKQSEDGEFDNGHQYYDMLTTEIIYPLEDFGYEDLSKFLAYRLNPLNSYSESMNIGVCAAIAELF